MHRECNVAHVEGEIDKETVRLIYWAEIDCARRLGVGQDSTQITDAMLVIYVKLVCQLSA